MWLDKQAMFSEDQTLVNAATGSTVTSTNVIDVTTLDIGKGEPIEVLMQMTSALTGGTLQVKLITSAYAGLTGSSTLYDSGAVAAATLVAGYQFPIRTLPNITKRYMGLLLINGTAPSTAGAISAGLVRHLQSNT